MRGVIDGGCQIVVVMHEVVVARVRGLSTRFTRRSRSLLPALLPVNVEACDVVGLSSRAQQRLTRSQNAKRRVEETRHLSQHARTTH